MVAAMHHRYSLEKQKNLVTTFLIRRSGAKQTKEC
jgi:hypothetical protein